MPEGLGKNLKEFFDKVDPSYKDAEITRNNIFGVVVEIL